MLNKILNFLDNEIHAWLDNKAPSEFKNALSKLGIAFLSIFFILICIFLVNLKKEPIKPPYLYMTPDQLALARDKKPFKAIQFHISNTPSMSVQKIKSWLSQSLTRSMSFNFSNIDSVLNSSSAYFSDSGYVYYMRSIVNSKLREHIIDDKLVSTLTVISEPKIVKTPKIVGDTLIWPDIETTALITYTGASKPITKKVLISVELIQAPTWKTPQGLTIQSITTATDVSHQ